jgi:hypothetical protein
VLELKQKTTAARKVSRKVTHTHAKPSTRGTNTSNNGGASSATKHMAPAPQVVAAAAGVLAAELASSPASAQALDYYRIPLFLLPIYRAAAVKYGVPWQILAAINEVETDYGHDLSVSTAGAVGWMQFMPATWAQYGVDALNAGYADPYNPADAIFAAARYLRSAGAQSNLRAAVLAYNHSEEYLNSVLLRAKLISTYPKPVIGTLTGLVDAGLPVTGGHVAWGALVPVASSSSAARRPQAPPDKTVLGRSPSATAGPSAAPPPSAAAAAATGADGTAAQARQLMDLMSTPNAAVVAVQAGRIMQLGRSRRLGRYVVLRDIYGDVFTYAGLGSIARTYSLPQAPRAPVRPVRVPVAAVASAHEGSPTQPANVDIRPPLTLMVRPSKRAADGAGASGGGASAPARPSASTRTGVGKVRLFAHPGNPDALSAKALTAAAAERRMGLADHALRLRVGSLVAKGTVLGHVRVPAGAKDGHLRFGLRPAGDPSAIDPAPILANWVLLNTTLHPQGAKGELDLLSATASDVFLLSKSQLQRDILSDPGIVTPRCFRAAVASGTVDTRVLALLGFLSRNGLKPTVGEQSCGRGAYRVSGHVVDHIHDWVAISQINGIPIAGHQGAGAITDTIIRTLLTLRGEFVPRRIVSLMHYPGARSTLARADHADCIEIDFSSTPTRGPAAGSGGVTAAQWDQLFARIGALPHQPAAASRPAGSSDKLAKRAMSPGPTAPRAYRRPRGQGASTRAGTRRAPA